MSEQEVPNEASQIAVPAAAVSSLAAPSPRDCGGSRPSDGWGRHRQPQEAEGDIRLRRLEPQEAEGDIREIVRKLGREIYIKRR